MGSFRLKALVGCCCSQLLIRLMSMLSRFGLPKYLFLLFLCRCLSLHKSNSSSSQISLSSSSLVWFNSKEDVDSDCLNWCSWWFVVVFLLLLQLLDTVDMDDDGEEGMEFECDDDGGVSNNGNDDSKGSFNLSSVSHSIKSSKSVRLITFLAASSASIISNVVVCLIRKFVERQYCKIFRFFYLIREVLLINTNSKSSWRENTDKLTSIGFSWFSSSSSSLSSSSSSPSSSSLCCSSSSCSVRTQTTSVSVDSSLLRSNSLIAIPCFRAMASNS